MKRIYMAGFLAGAFLAGVAVAWFAWGMGKSRSPTDDQARAMRKIQATLDELIEQTAAAVKAPKNLPATVVSDESQVARTAVVDEKLDALATQQEFQTGMLMRLVAAEDAKYQRALHHGLALQKEGNHAAAIAVFTVNVDNRPELFNAYVLRGVSRMELEQWEAAIADCTVAGALAPQSSDPSNNLAWIRATCPEKKFRDGAAAVELATEACRLTDWSDPGCLSTLAAAYAEQGDFEAAVKWQKTCLDLTTGEAAAQFHAVLALYENDEPYRTQRKPPEPTTSEDALP